MSSRQKIIRFLQQEKRVTRPQIAAALGLSLVSTNACVARLEKEGIIRPGGLRSSGGGRPVREYIFNPEHGVVVLISARAEAHCTLLLMELLDLQGHKLEEKQARYVQLHAESLDEWLDNAATRRKLLRICLPPGLGQDILAHLQERHSCPVQEYAEAEALVSGRERSMTLLLQKGRAPQGAWLHHGILTPCPLLQHIPLPGDWETMDYSDHTLVEENIARLLQLLTCTLAPAHIELHADFWNDRLISRLRFNLATKLRNLPDAPQLHFATITPDKIPARLYHYVTRLPNP